jgi:hypothetical protein
MNSLKLRKKRLAFKTAEKVWTRKYYTMVLYHFFWIKGFTDDERIEYVSGKHSILELKN